MYHLMPDHFAYFVCVHVPFSNVPKLTSYSCVTLFTNIQRNEWSFYLMYGEKSSHLMMFFRSPGSMLFWFISPYIPAVAGFSVLLTILLPVDDDLFLYLIPSPLATIFPSPFNTRSNSITTNSGNKLLLKA